MLTARHPFPDYPGRLSETVPAMLADRRDTLPSPRALNPTLPPAVDSIVRHCLQPDPARRYQSAADLREDLERQLAGRPLRHAPNPSPSELAGKWLRRHPRVSWMTALAALVVVVMVVAGVSARRGEQLAQVRADEAFAAFRDEQAQAQALLNTRSGDGDQLRRGRTIARQALARYRALDGDWRASPEAKRLDETRREQLRRGVGEVLLLLARAERQVAQARPTIPTTWRAASCAW